MKKNSSAAEIIVADSESDANLYYATRFMVPDPVFFFRVKGKSYLLLNDLEVDRGRKEARVDHVIRLSEWQRKVQQRLKRQPGSVDLMVAFLNEKGVREAILPQTFPAYLATELQKRKIRLSFRSDPFWTRRLIKTKEEKEAIRFSLKNTGNAIRKAYDVLRASKIKNKSIFYEGRGLTSERLKQVIDVHLLENQCLAKNTIVAGGDQAVDPHERGHGPLKANQSIVMDVFPRSIKSQYYADMTRTVVKGKPTPELKKIWQTVKEAQERGIDMVHDGVDGQKIHNWISDFFEGKGYRTGLIGGRMQGFFHSTGHGLGLDIHEPPRISKLSHILKEGMVVTVEPGLYYKGIGGVRIEDVVYVTKKGCEVLSSCPKIVAIP